MNKITITKTGYYISKKPLVINGITVVPEVIVTKALYNYVVTGGDVKQYITDKKAERLSNGKEALSIQDNSLGNTLPEHIGLPRFVSTTFLGETAVVDRVQRKDKSFGWFADTSDALLEESLMASAPAYVKAEAGRMGVLAIQEQVRQLKLEKQLAQERIMDMNKIPVKPVVENLGSK